MHNLRKITRLAAAGLALALLCCLFAGGCDNKKEEAAASSTPEFPVTAGGVTLEEAPGRVVCLAPAIYEALEELGATASLVGVGAGIDAGGLPALGSPALPDVEAIIGLSPDLILTSAQPDSTDADSLALQEIPVAVIPSPLRYGELEDYYQQISVLISGSQTGAANAARTAERLGTEAGAAAGAAAGKTPVKTALLLGEGLCAGGDTWAGDLLELAGGSNALAGTEGYAYTTDTLTAAAPEAILCPAGMAASLLADESLAGIPALQAGRVYEIDTALLERPGASLAAAVEAMAKALYPADAGTSSSAPETVE